MARRLSGSVDRIRLSLAVAVLIGFVFRVWGLGWGLQNASISRRPHPDEWPIYWLFQWFHGALPLNPCPNATGQCFFDWGTAFPYLAYVVHGLISPIWHVVPASVFGPHADVLFVHDVFAARFTSALLSTAAIVMTYVLARDSFGRRAGLVAAILVAVSALPIQLGHFGTPDSLSSVLLAFTLWRSMKLLHAPSRRNLLLAAAGVGAASGCEYHLVLLIFPVGCAYLLARGRNWRDVAFAGLTGIVVFFVLNPYVLIDFQGFIAATQHTLRIRTVDSGIQYQGRWAAYDPAWLYVVRFALAYGVSVPITVWFLVGAVRSMWRHSCDDLVLLTWILPYFILVSASPAKFMRYSALLIIPLAVVGGVASTELWNRVRSRIRPLLGAVLAGAMLFASIYDAAYLGLFTAPDPRAVATDEVVAQAAAGTAVAFAEVPDGLVNLPYYLDGHGLKICIAEFKTAHLAGARYLMLDQYGIEEHPRIPTATVTRFLKTVQSNSVGTTIAHVSYVPTFLGLSFPIDASPHDWRYPAHEITVYRLASQVTTGAGSQCYNSADAAAAVLRPREIQAALRGQ